MLLRQMSNKANVPELFASRRVAAVCFDVDSTVSPHEGIDEFAAFLGMGEDVAKVTKQVRNAPCFAQAGMIIWSYGSPELPEKAGQFVASAH